MQSDPISVRVRGAPRVMTARYHSAAHVATDSSSSSSSSSSLREVRARSGETVRLEVAFCADPAPRQAWNLGRRGGHDSVILSSGTQHGRFLAEEAARAADGRDNCYVAALRIEGVHADDSGAYELGLTNEHGTDSHTVRLTVRSESLQHIFPKK